MKYPETRTYMKKQDEDIPVYQLGYTEFEYTDHKTAEDRLNRAGTNDWKGTLLSVIVGTILAFMLAGLLGLVLGALSALI